MSAADALHALKVHLTPLFDASAVLVASSPAGKANELAISLGEAHTGEPLPVIPEEELSAKLGGAGRDEVDVEQVGRPERGDDPLPATREVAPPKTTTSGAGKSAGGHGKSGFSKQFKCECPKCDPAFQVKVAFGGKLTMS